MTNPPNRLSAQAAAAAGQKPRPRRLWPLILVIIICVLPVIASYLTYYVIRPHGASTNYGVLIEPQRPIPTALTAHTDDGRVLPLASFKGKWLMVSVNSGACDTACATKLYFMRQIRALQGNERDRVVTLWLRTDTVPVSAAIRNAYGDTQMLIADPAALADWLPADSGTAITDHIYLVDPNGNLMMRFPKDPQPEKINADLHKLMTWSGIG